ncbi:MAG TPA: GDSL-type esterase/lipase family protein [Planctomycetota bacterium]|nr:GDSL-type esterase/lipase family protein [Planctomycetota bacterium]
MIARLLIAFVLSAAPQSEKIRIACVGDSITFGACVQDREKNCYPAVLGGLLGDKYDVRNFGVNGATLLKKGDLPWWNQGAFTEATAFDPNIVVIKLGSNDTKPQNWRSKADFEADYKALIEHFKGLPSKPTVWVALPVPVLKENFGINKKGAEEQQPLIARVAKEEGCGTIDLYRAVATKDLFDQDGIHPNAAGARKIAETVFASLSAKRRTK